MALFRNEDDPSVIARLPARALPWVRHLRTRTREINSEVEKWIDLQVGGGTYSRLRKYRHYFFFVVLPTLLVAAYYYLISADQYLSEAHFMVLGTSKSSVASSSTQLLSSSGSTGDAETFAVLDFMESQNAVSELRKQLDIEKIYRKPWIDVVARIGANPTAEEVYEYLFGYGRMVDPYYDFTSGVGVLRVYAFNPNDTQKVADTLLNLGDQLVDRLNKRSEKDAVRVAHVEVSRAEERVAQVEEKITAFQLKERELDLTKSANTISDVIGKLEEDLAKARAELTEESAYLKPDSPTFQEQQNKVAALQSQIAAQQARLTGPNGALAPDLAAYQRLTLEREFANKDYEAALKAMEEAYLQAARQHLFLVRTIDATVAEESRYPRRLLMIFSLFASLTVAYGIGWLIVAGVREHGG